MRIFWICPSSWRTPPCTSVWASSKPAVAPGPPLGKHPYVLHPAAAREVRSQPGSGLCWWLCCEGFACIPQPRLCLLHVLGSQPVSLSGGTEGQKLAMLCTWCNGTGDLCSISSAAKLYWLPGCGERHAAKLKGNNLNYQRQHRTIPDIFYRIAKSFYNA